MASWFANACCAVGLHGTRYVLEKTKVEKNGEVKNIVSLVKVCPFCEGGRKVIVHRSLLLGD